MIYLCHISKDASGLPKAEKSFNFARAIILLTSLLMAPAQTLLISRLSAIGDVAMVVPLLQAALERYPHLHLVVLTRPFLRELFLPLPRTQVHPVDLQGRHRGLPGLWRLSQELTDHYPLDGMVDLHDVLRTQVLRRLLHLRGLPVSRLHKDRAARRRLTRRSHKDRRPARHSFDLYAEALARAGFPVEVDAATAPTLDFSAFAPTQGWPALPHPWVGIGPFASRPEKTYPTERIAAVAEALAQDGLTVWLFGGAGDRPWFEALVQRHPHLRIAPIDPLREEMALIQQLDLMVSPDSANGHLARLVGVPTLSLWGPTHPDAGFRPLGPPEAVHALQMTTGELACRACFVVKARPCYRGDHACMQRLAASQLEQRIRQLIR